MFLILEYDLFLSHNWGNDNSNHNKVAVINEELRRRGYRTWFDEEQMPASTFTEKAMSRGISHSKVFILFLTKDYMTKVNGNAGRGVLDNCYLEFKYAIKKKTPLNMVTVVLERVRNSFYSRQRDLFFNEISYIKVNFAVF